MRTIHKHGFYYDLLLKQRKHLFSCSFIANKKLQQNNYILITYYICRILSINSNGIQLSLITKEYKRLWQYLRVFEKKLIILQYSES
jgi:hypothetical protein